MSEAITINVTLDGDDLIRITDKVVLQTLSMVVNTLEAENDVEKVKEKLLTAINGIVEKNKERE